MKSQYPMENQMIEQAASATSIIRPFGLRLIVILCLLATAPVSAQDAFFVAPDGNVGIGTGFPSAPLEIVRQDNSAEIQVRDTAPGFRTMFRLVNNGQTNFRMENTEGQVWQFTNTNNGFVITRSGTPGPELFVHNHGNVEIRGTLTENSSRSVKHAIQALDGNEVLEKLEELAISMWRYDDNPGSVHVGPMAEDWYDTFGLGRDNQGVAPRDLAGVALAAAQALKAENRELRARLESIEAKLDQD